MTSSTSPKTNATCRVLIVEDEVHARRYLRTLLQAEDGVVVVGEAADGPGAAEMIVALLPDLVFVDVQLVELDGFEMIARVGIERMPPFIVVSGSREHAARAYDLEALDYLCKPFGQERLAASLARFRRNKGRSDREPLEPFRAVEKANRRLSIKLESGMAFVPIEAVLWVEAANKYVVLHTVQRSYISRRTIQSVLDELGLEQFVRIHRSIVVRKNAVQNVRPLFHGDHIVVLKEGTELTLSRKYRETFFLEMAH